MQKPELFPDEEQKDYHRTAGVQEVLPILPEAPCPQGDQVGAGDPGPRVGYNSGGEILTARE
jgi:hypothetical protein